MARRPRPRRRPGTARWTTFASIAQAAYVEGSWHGSIGLKSRLFKAPSKAAAIDEADRFYMREWKASKEPGMRLVKLHVSVERY